MGFLQSNPEEGFICYMDHISCASSARGGEVPFAKRRQVLAIETRATHLITQSVVVVLLRLIS